MEVKKSQLKEVIAREYASMFDPMERQFYTPQVEFIDPLNSFKGVDKYQGNVDLLGGRSLLGRLVFRDAYIHLHTFTDLDEYRFETRWTLGLTMKVLPWQPEAVITGTSVHPQQTGREHKTDS